MLKTMETSVLEAKIMDVSIRINELDKLSLKAFELNTMIISPKSLYYKV